MLRFYKDDDITSQIFMTLNSLNGAIAIATKYWTRDEIAFECGTLNSLNGAIAIATKENEKMYKLAEKMLSIP